MEDIFEVGHEVVPPGVALLQIYLPSIVMSIAVRCFFASPEAFPRHVLLFFQPGAVFLSAKVLQLFPGLFARFTRRELALSECFTSTARFRDGDGDFGNLCDCIDLCRYS